MSHTREKSLPILDLSDEQTRKLDDLWFTYGNNGPKHTDGNHKFIQRFLDAQQDQRAFYRPTAECIQAVDHILKSV